MPRFGGDAARLSLFGDAADGTRVLNAAWQAITRHLGNQVMRQATAQDLTQVVPAPER